MSFFNLFRRADPGSAAVQAENELRRADIVDSLQHGRVPTATRARLEGSRNGTLPWTATLSPAELLIARSHGLKPVASVSATCWLHHGWSWTEGHAQGWEMALRRLREEAKAAGANAVLDVKMRTIPLGVENSTDFTLIGTAVRVEGLRPSDHPIVATVPALEFVKLLEADVVPTGIAIGAKYHWLTDWRGATNQAWLGNQETKILSNFWEMIRRDAHAEMRRSAKSQGNGVLAHVNFSQLFEREDGKAKRFLGRHIVIATTVDARDDVQIAHDIQMVVDMHAGATPLTGTRPHHQSYASNEREGGI
ncbi:MAG TPA: heavy metal-binding domain-containing protein [Aliidongia sp.]|uniref:heavy metal-binding domain-containing protein n=1 Tax=Aliidongia sp. TaxID=1914230 RepID=UPI002DDCC8F6|nr:heavy metal-binding domain-containing protein [Aliidongia sp.]HEV2678122.1 heavy metal-binding domain-containing protein [Aliidongia sp.]